MSRRVEREGDLYTIEWDSDHDAVIFTWDEFTAGEQFREGANELLGFVRSRDASKLVVDTSGIRAHRDEDQRWLDEVWIPKLLAAGIEHASRVHRDSAIAQRYVETVLDELDENPSPGHVAGSGDEAREWVADPEEPELLQ